VYGSGREGKRGCMDGRGDGREREIVDVDVDRRVGEVSRGESAFLITTKKDNKTR